jgi:hypothetical protein
VHDLAGFSTAQDLFEYLQRTHPPQYPGKLAEQDYWSVTAFVWHLAGRLAEGGQVGPAVQAGPDMDSPLALVVVAGAILILWLALTWQARLGAKKEEDTHVLP